MLGVAGVSASLIGGRATERFRRVAEVPRGLGQILSLLLPGEPLEPSGLFHRFFGELSLGIARSARLRLHRHRLPELFILLLQAPREFPDLVGGLVDFAGRLFRLAALECLVLVTELVQFQAEEIGQVFRRGAEPSAAALAAASTAL